MTNPSRATLLGAPERLALRQYKYRGEDRSITRLYLMDPIYNRLAQLFPSWMAPNIITLIGFAFIVASHILLLYYSPTLSEPAPRYVYAFASIALFSYMVLDNLDGKQARRTNSSSALGQLFDHGCDALNVTLSGMSLIAMSQQGCNVRAMACLLSVGHTVLFMATLEEFLTGAMILRKLNGPNEGLLALCAAQALTAVLGPQMWSLSVEEVAMALGIKSTWIRLLLPSWLLSVAFNDTLVVLCVVITIFSVWGNVHGILSTRAQYKREQTHVAQSTGAVDAMLEMGAMCVPMACYTAMFATTAVAGGETFERVGVWLMWMCGGGVYDLITRMMMAHLTGGTYPCMSWVVVACAASCATVVAKELGGVRVEVTGAVIATTVAIASWNLWRAMVVIRDICDALNCRCFSLKKMRPGEHTFVGDGSGSRGGSRGGRVHGD